MNIRQSFAYFVCMVFLLALLFSKFTMTLGMIAFAALAVFNPKIKDNIRYFFQHKGYMALTAVFFIVALSFFNSEDVGYWGERLRIKLPFLALPFAFASLPPFSKRQFYGIFYVLLILMIVTSISIGINYALNFDEINLAIKQGRSMPTPISHIRYSLLMAWSILVGGYLWGQHFYYKWSWERYFIGGMTLFLLVFIHVLSVRSGLAVLYLTTGVLAFRYIYLTGRYMIGIAAIVGMMALPITAYYTMPSFQTKIAYMLYDKKQYDTGQDIKQYSDSERIISLKVGLEIGNSSPLFGVGYGDFKNEVDRIYQEKYEGMMPKLPHNQWITFYAATGIVGTLAFLICLLIPLFYKKAYQNYFMLSLYIIVFTSFLIENTIENAVGTAIFTFFLVLIINQLSEK